MDSSKKEAKDRKAHAVYYYRTGLPVALLLTVWILSRLVIGIASAVVAALLVGGLVYAFYRPEGRKVWFWVTQRDLIEGFKRDLIIHLDALQELHAYSTHRNQSVKVVEAHDHGHYLEATIHLPVGATVDFVEAAAPQLAVAFQCLRVEVARVLGKSHLAVIRVYFSDPLDVMPEW